MKSDKRLWNHHVLTVPFQSLQHLRTSCKTPVHIQRVPLLLPLLFADSYPNVMIQYHGVYLSFIFVMTCRCMSSAELCANTYSRAFFPFPRRKCNHFLVDQSYILIKIFFTFRNLLFISWTALQKRSCYPPLH